jgi:hypothetical protein
MGWFSKTSAAVGIATAIATGHSADKVRDNYAKGREREDRAKTERSASRRNETYSSMKK